METASDIRERIKKYIDTIHDVEHLKRMEIVVSEMVEQHKKNIKFPDDFIAELNESRINYLTGKETKYDFKAIREKFEKEHNVTIH
jgi:small-conductance mechanosensitive channel